MIKGEHLHKEITAINDLQKTLKDPFQKTAVQIGVLALKLLLNIRQNQVAIMNHQGIELIKPKLNATQEPQE